MSIEYYLRRLVPGNSVCELFQAASNDVWERIKFSRTVPRLKIHETTITQNLVYEFKLLKVDYGFPGLTLYESVNEAANGDDLELCLMYPEGIIKFAVQAKIIYHKNVKKVKVLSDGSYPRLNHHVGRAKDNQVDLLIDYAKSNDCYPLYLFYNYVNRGLRGISHMERYGCSFTSAYYLKQNYGTSDGNLSDKLNFREIHPKNSFPWDALACIPYQSLCNLIEVVDKLHLEELVLHTREEINNDPNWAEMSSDFKNTKVIEYQFERTRNNTTDENYRSSFNPKYRLMITINYGDNRIKSNSQKHK